MVASIITCPVAASRDQEPIDHSMLAFEAGSLGFSSGQSEESPETAEFVFVLPNDRAQITPVVEFLAAEATRVAICDAAEQMRISLALEEALANALYHGNLEINSDAAGTEQMCRHEVAQWRSRQQPFCDRRIRVLASIARSAAVFVIRDQGRGFEPSLLPDPTDDANLGRCCGRGVFLMRSLMDEVIFNEIGNEVTMVRRWNTQPADSTDD